MVYVNINTEPETSHPALFSCKWQGIASRDNLTPLFICLSQQPGQRQKSRSTAIITKKKITLRSADQLLQHLAPRPEPLATSPWDYRDSS